MDKIHNYVLWGSAGHAKVLAEIVASKGGKVLALFDNQEVISALNGVPIYFGISGFKSWLESREDLMDVAGLISIGGSKGSDRLKIQALFNGYGIATPTLTHPTAVISDTAFLDSGTQVLALANIAAEVQVGKACIINHCASIDHECILGNGVHVAPGATLCGCVSLANNVFVGAGAVILPRLSIGENVVIGAGAVVTKDIPAGFTVAGNPAKKIINKEVGN
jgi:sugar O-acyltransferase (sialic acid O-acetyltransferase NeuD family)